MGTTRVFTATAAAVLLGVAGVQAEGLPTCRIRLVRSAETDALAKATVAQVESWANAPERGCRLVSSIDEADVLLEFNQYRPTTAPDGTPQEQWWFIARRLSEPDRQRGTHRFVFGTFLADRRTKDHVARELPTVLVDVCFGYLPKAGPSAP